MEIITAPAQFEAIKNTLEAAGYEFEDAEITMIPDNTVEIAPTRHNKFGLLEVSEDLDDIQEVHTNEI